MTEVIRVNQIKFCNMCFILVDITRMKDTSTFPFTKTVIADIMTSDESTASHKKLTEDLKRTSLTTDSGSVTSFSYMKPLQTSISESSSMVFSSYSSDQDRIPGDQMETTQNFSPL